MSYILTVVLFSGTVIHGEYPTKSACENGLYYTIDKELPKNVKFSDCVVSEKK